MADISQITLPSGTTYDIKDAVARAKAAISVKGNTKVFYTSCQTPASTAAKTMSCTNFDAATDLVSGTILFVFFETANDVDNITFEINNSGAKSVAVNASTTATSKAWKSGEVGCFIFNETADFWIMVDSGQATTDYYGVTKLSNATNSTSQDLAATPKAVKDALDAAKAYADGLDTGVTSVNGQTGAVVLDADDIEFNGVSVKTDLEMLADEVDDLWDQKVDKIAGKGLSTNDYTTTEKNKLAGIAAGAEVNVQSDWNQTTTTADDYIKNKPTLGAAAAKGVDTSIAASSTSVNLPTSAAVETRIQAAIAEAEVGSAAFQGVVNSNTDISGLSDYKKGWYWVVGTAGTYLTGTGTTGQVCEVGDFIFCISDRASAYAPADFKVVQANIDMSQFGDLAFKDTATGNVSVTSSDAVTSVSHGLDSATASGDDTVLKDVTNAAPTFTGTQKYLHLSTTKGTVTSTGNASLTTSDAVTAVSGSVNTTSTNGIDIKPAGTVSTPTITVTPSTTTKYVASSATGGGTVTNGTAAQCTMPDFNVSNENLTITAGSFTANTPTAVTLPSFSSQTIATGITSATSTQPSFTGTQKYLHLSTTKDTVTSTGSISVTTSGAVTAVSGSVNTTATDGIDIKPAGSVSAPVLTKTYVKPKVTATKGTTTSTGTVTVS